MTDFTRFALHLITIIALGLVVLVEFFPSAGVGI